MGERVSDAGANDASAEPVLAVPVGADDHVLGMADEPLSLVLYGDYQCPLTRAVLPVVHDVRERLGEVLCYAYRHFPLRAAHPHAQSAAEAAEAADAQGMFWAMHDMLFTNQHALDFPDLVHYVQLLGLDAHRVQRELLDHQHAARVERDVASGRASAVATTPALFVNGARFIGVPETDVIVNALLATGGMT